MTHTEERILLLRSAEDAIRRGFSLTDDRSLSERLTKIGLSKAVSSEKEASAELLSSFYLSTTQSRNREAQTEKLKQNEARTERIAHKAVKLLGEAIGKKWP